MPKQVDLMAGIEAELLQERMFALGQAGKKVEHGLAALAAAPDATGARLDDLLHDAAYAVWSYLIMRESLGMFDHAEAMKIFGVPGRVMARVGVVRPPPAK